MANELKKMVGEKEEIIYEGKPYKKCFIFEGIFNPFFPIALIWGCIDFFAIRASIPMDISNSISYGFGFFFIAFFALHLMPVWLYLGGCLMIMRKYKNAHYIVTNKVIYVSSGALAKRFSSCPFREISHVDLHRGLFDQMFGVGDIIATTNRVVRNHNSNGRPCYAKISINSILYYTDVYKIVKMLQQSQYSDLD